MQNTTERPVFSSFAEFKKHRTEKKLKKKSVSFKEAPKNEEIIENLKPKYTMEIEKEIKQAKLIILQETYSPMKPIKLDSLMIALNEKWNYEQQKEEEDLEF